MAIIFSKGCEYGMQAALFIATQHERRVGIREIAHELSIPAHFLAKILQTLNEKGILQSFKGSSGGFTLKGEPSDIHLLDIVLALDGEQIFHSCVLGFPDCGDEHPCPVHETWGALRNTIRDMLSKESLADLMPVSRTKIASILEMARLAESEKGETPLRRPPTTLTATN